MAFEAADSIGRQLRELPSNHRDRDFLEGVHSALLTYLKDRREGSVVYQRNPEPPKGSFAAVYREFKTYDPEAGTVVDFGKTVLSPLFALQVREVLNAGGLPDETLLKTLRLPQNQEIWTDRQRSSYHKALDALGKDITVVTLGDLRNASPTTLTEIRNISTRSAVFMQYAFRREESPRT